jgi:Tfp pilus assembly protein FimT
MGERKSAFTLIELLVYMAIMGFIIVVAGKVFSDSTVMRVRSHNMVKTSEAVGKTSALLREDISQMGTKVWLKEQTSVSASGDSSTRLEITVEDDVYWASNDHSSYKLIRIENNGVFSDSLTFKKAVFDDDGKFEAVHTITWTVNSNRQLMRECKSSKASDNDCPASVVIADSVVNFKLTPSVPGMAANTQDDTLFSGNFNLLSGGVGSNIVAITSIVNSGTATTVSNFAQNPLDASDVGKSFNQLYLAAGGKNLWGECEKITFEKGETYAIEFSMPFSMPTSINADNAEEAQRISNSTQFMPGRDHLAIGLRGSDGLPVVGAPNDILFYPPQSAGDATQARHAEFSVSDTVNACVAITMAFYPPKQGVGAGASQLRFSNFKVLRKSNETFHFPATGLYGIGGENTAGKINEKKNVKAFELVLEIQHRGEKSGTFSNDGKGMVIITPNNGIAQ